MGKEDYYVTVMSVVTDLTDLSENEIINGRKTMEVVDARWLAVRLMRDLGLYPYQIAELMEMTTRNVTYILNNFDDRMMFGDIMLRNYLAVAEMRLGNKKEMREK